MPLFSSFTSLRNFWDEKGLLSFDSCFILLRLPRYAQLLGDVK